MKKTILICTLALTIFSCSKNQDAGPPTVAYVKDAETLMAAMTISGGIIKNGDIPVPTGIHTDNIVSMPNTVVVTTNSLFTIPMKTEISGGRRPTMMFIKLEGSDKYYQINLDANGNAIPTNRLSIPLKTSCFGKIVKVELTPTGGLNQHPFIDIPAKVYTFSPPLSNSGDLTFFVDPQYWSLQHDITFKALDVGSGDVQISLTWDTHTDVDLWLLEPNGNKIYYANKTSDTGGELDYDNTIEYGPENIFYKDIAPSGIYKVQVNYYSGAPTATHYNVVVKNGNAINTYEGDLNTYSQVNTIATFTK